MHIAARSIENIGFFHFGDEKKEDPLASFKTALLVEIDKSEGKCLGNSLVVIPEAFNLIGGYWGSGRHADPSISKSLLKMSAELGIAFVVGIIEPPRTGAPQYSSAYLIDGSYNKLLSRKMEDDRSANYQTCDSSWDRVLRHRGLVLAALICMDAANSAGLRQQSIFFELRRFKPDPAVLCIPACMGSYSSEQIARSIPSGIVALIANSSVSNPSVIRCDDTLILSNKNTENLIRMTSLARFVAT